MVSVFVMLFVLAFLLQNCFIVFIVDFEDTVLVRLMLILKSLKVMKMSLLFTLKTFLLHLYYWTLIHHYHVFII